MLLKTIVASLFFIGSAAAQDIPDCGPEPVDGWVDRAWQAPAQGAVEIPEAHILVVPAGTRPAAISALINVPIVPLTEAELKTLVPGAPIPDGAPYLVRAVLANEMGHFTARALGDTLWVENYTLGCFDMTKAPIVVFLDEAPAILKIGVGGAF